MAMTSTARSRLGIFVVGAGFFVIFFHGQPITIDVPHGFAPNSQSIAPCSSSLKRPSPVIRR